MTISTTDGTPSKCPVCGKRLWLTPSDSPGDATCPHCGSLVWFSECLTEDTIKTLADRGVDVDLDAEGEITTIRLSGDIYDDSTIRQLARLRDVETLDIRDTKISLVGAERLKELMPDVKIIHNK